MPYAKLFFSKEEKLERDGKAERLSACCYNRTLFYCDLDPLLCSLLWFVLILCCLESISIVVSQSKWWINNWQDRTYFSLKVVLWTKGIWIVLFCFGGLVSNSNFLNEAYVYMSYMCWSFFLYILEGERQVVFRVKICFQ